MANSFGTDILIQAQDPRNAASFYVEQLGFTITGEKPNMISLHGGCYVRDPFGLIYNLTTGNALIS